MCWCGVVRCVCNQPSSSIAIITYGVFRRTSYITEVCISIVCIKEPTHLKLCMSYLLKIIIHNHIIPSVTTIKAFGYLISISTYYLSSEMMYTTTATASSPVVIKIRHPHDIPHPPTYPLNAVAGYTERFERHGSRPKKACSGSYTASIPQRERRRHYE